MNAYFASFMLLVLNAVGLAMPATDTVAEERIASDTNLDHEQNDIGFVSEKAKDDLLGGCNAGQNNGFDVDREQSCELFSTLANLPSETLGKNAPQIFVTYHPLQQSGLPDNLYVEGAP